MPKKWWQSKTIWFNALAAAGVVLEANINMLQGTLPPSAYVVLATLLAGGNVVLRMVTTSPIGKGESE